MLLSPSEFSRLCRGRDRLHEGAELTVNALARELGMSPFQFIRQFQALFGETPHQLRIQARIELAKRLLAHEHSSVTGVCMDVGFSSLGSFSSSFTRRVGVNPSQYRRRFVQVPCALIRPPLILGCFGMLAQLPAGAFRNSGEARLRV